MKTRRSFVISRSPKKNFLPRQPQHRKKLRESDFRTTASMYRFFLLFATPARRQESPAHIRHGHNTPPAPSRRNNWTSLPPALWTFRAAVCGQKRNSLLLDIWVTERRSFWEFLPSFLPFPPVLLSGQPCPHHTDKDRVPADTGSFVMSRESDIVSAHPHIIPPPPPVSHDAFYAI
jgi:hypothetical protein